MRIVIDLQGAQGVSSHRGIGRYSLEFALSVARNRKNHEIIIALNGLLPERIDEIRHAFDNVLPPSAIRVWYGVGTATGQSKSDHSRREMSKVLREAFMESLEPDIVHITSLFEGFGDDAVHSVPNRRSYLTSSTFYDLIPLNNADVYLDSSPIYKNFYLNIIPDLLQVDLHLTISEYSRSELIKSLEIAPERVKNVYAGADKIFRRTGVDRDLGYLRSRFQITKPFLLYSGAADERKNHLRLLEAFSQSKFKEEAQLVLVGHWPPDRTRAFNEQINLLRLNDKVIITGMVPDDDLVFLYNKCSLFVFPAWQEGFGLPLLEAMQCGAPVIGANTSCVPEILDHPDALFDPFDVQSIRTAVDKALGNRAFLDEMRVHGEKRASFFSWDRVGTDAIKFFQAAFKARRRPSVKRDKESVSQFLGVKPQSAISNRDSAVEAVNSLLSSQHGLIDLTAQVPWRETAPPIQFSELPGISKAVALNHPTRKMNQLFIDISELVHQDARTGIQRLVRSVLYELMTSYAVDYRGYKVEAVYANVNGTGYRYAREFCCRVFDGLCTPLPDDLIDVRSGDVFIAVDLHQYVVISQAKILQDLRTAGVEVYFVVYDLLPVLLPETFPEGTEQLHRQWLEVISTCDGLICITRSVADELLAWLGQSGVARRRPLKIGWFHLGADVMKSMPNMGSDHVLQPLKSLKDVPTFLMVGTLEPRKGHAQTLAAFEKMWADGLEAALVIVGKAGWGVEKLIQSIEGSNELGKRLFWLSSLSDNALETLYAETDCLIMASHGEGFGLPLVEAAKHRLHIFARSIPVFKEIAGDSAFYFEGTSTFAMVEALKEWLDQFARDIAPKSETLSWLTWAQSTQQLCSIILDNRWYHKWDGLNRGSATTPEEN